jgi:hypothetical protein
MFKKILSVAVALSLSLTPAMAATNQFVFRYKFPSYDAPTTPPTEQPVFGKGNDIRAYFVAPINKGFTRQIPVATHDVISWIRDTGELPDGLSVSSGKVVGDPDVAEKTTAVYIGFDASGHKIARAQINIVTFEPIGENQEVDWYAHTGTYFYSQVPVADGITVQSWEPMDGLANPDGMATRSDAFDGNPTLAGTYGLGWIGYDYLHRPIATASGNFLVEDGPVFSAGIDSQTVDKEKNETFKGAPTIGRNLGVVTYRLVPVTTRHGGLGFASDSGTLSKVFDDFNISEEFYVEARDSYDGTTGRTATFRLTTLPSTKPSAALAFTTNPITVRVNTPFTTSGVKSEKVLSGVAYTVTDPLPGDLKSAGAIISTATGIAEAGTYNFTITASKTGEDSFQKAQQVIVLGDLALTYQDLTLKRHDYKQIFPDYNPDDVRGDLKFAVVGSPLPDFMSMDKNGRITIFPEMTVVVGKYGPFNVSISDDMTPTPMKSADFYVDVVDREKIVVTAPAHVTLEQYVTTGLQDIASATNALHNVASYRLTAGKLPDGLKVAGFWNRGILSGSTTDPIGTVYSGLKVTATDADGAPYEDESDEFDITVVKPSDLKPLTGSLNVTYTWAEDIPFKDFKLPELANAYGTVSYTLNGDTHGLTTNGLKLEGKIAEPGTYAIPYQIKDDTDRPAVAGTITLVIQPEMGVTAESVYHLNRGTYAEVKPVRTNGVAPFSYRLGQGSQLPAGMQFKEKTGYIYGTPTLQGDFTATVYVTDKTSDVRGTSPAFTMTVEPPLPFDFAYNDGTNDVIWVTTGTNWNVTAKLTNPLGSTKWELLSGNLPTDFSFNATTGAFTGTPTETALIPNVCVRGTDSENPDDPKTHCFTVKISPPGNVAFSAKTFRARIGAISKSYSLVPTNTVAPVTYSFADGSETYPDNIFLNSTTGVLTGAFADTGRYVVSVKAVDYLDREATASFAFDMVGALELKAPETATFKQYQENTVATTTLNEIGAISYSLAPGSAALPKGVTLDHDTGALSAKKDEATDYATVNGVIIRATDAYDSTFDDSDPIIVAIEKRDPLTAQVAAVNIKQFTSINAKISYAGNMGPVTFGASTPPLPDGLRFDPATESVVGRLDVPLSGSFVIPLADTKGGVLGSANATLSINVEARKQLTLTSGQPIIGKQYTPAGSVQSATMAGDIAAVDWSISPQLPEGLYFDLTTGEITGTPQVAAVDQTYHITATDHKGGSLGEGSTDIHLSVAARDPLTLDGPSTFSFNLYAPGYFNLSESGHVGEYRFSVAPALPDGIVLDPVTGRIDGTPSAMMSNKLYTFTVTDQYDHQDHQVIMTVNDRLAPVITTSGTLYALLGHQYPQALSADHVFGTPSWELISGNIPDGLQFKQDTGSFVGTPTTFKAYPNLVFKVYDTFKGVTTPSVTQTIAINVISDSTPITLTAKDATTRVGYTLKTDVPSAAPIVGTPTWSATGLDGSGFTINPTTGVISGPATRTQTVTATITVKDTADRSASQTVTLKAVPAMTLDFPLLSDLTYNRSFSDIAHAQPGLSNNHATAAWSISGAANLPAGLTFDTTTGQFTGKPNQIGAFGPVTITATDDLPGSISLGPINFTVYMNNDPITLSVTDILTKAGTQFASAAPVFGNTLGQQTFYSLDLGGTNLKVDPNTGVLTGSFSTFMDETYNISITDDQTLRVTSRPLRVQVLPKMVLTGPTLAVIPAQQLMTPVVVTRSYAVGTSPWDPIDPSRLPEGVSFNTSTGQFEGTPQDIGDFGPFVVTSTDSLNDTGHSNPITIRSQPGAYFLKLADAKLPAGTKKLAPYSYDFRNLLTLSGMDSSEVAFTWINAKTDGTPLPGGLTLSATGVLSGTPTRWGDFAFNVTATGHGKTMTKTYTLSIAKIPLVLTLDAGSIPGASTVAKYNFDFNSLTTKTNIADNEVTWTIDQTDGLTFLQGVLSGYVNLPSGTQQSFPLSLTATYNDGQDKIVAANNYTLVVTKGSAPNTYWRVDFYQSWGASSPTAGELYVYDANGVEYVHNNATLRTFTGALHMNNGVATAFSVNPTSQVMNFKEPVVLKKFVFPQAQNFGPTYQTKNVRVYSSANGTTWTLVYDTATNGGILQSESATVTRTW